jgi:hypothetical protein
MAAPLDLIERGEYNHEVPVMIGSVRDETAFFQIKIHTPPHLTELEFDAAQAALSHGVSLQTLKQLYDPAVYEYPEELGNYSRWFWTNMRVGTDKGEWAPSGAIDPDPYIYGLVSVACFSWNPTASPRSWPLRCALLGATASERGHTSSILLFLHSCGTSSSAWDTRPGPWQPVRCAR